MQSVLAMKSIKCDYHTGCHDSWDVKKDVMQVWGRVSYSGHAEENKDVMKMWRKLSWRCNKDFMQMWWMLSNKWVGGCHAHARRAVMQTWGRMWCRCDWCCHADAKKAVMSSLGRYVFGSEISYNKAPPPPAWASLLNSPKSQKSLRHWISKNHGPWISKNSWAMNFEKFMDHEFPKIVEHWFSKIFGLWYFFLFIWKIQNFQKFKELCFDFIYIFFFI